MHPITEKQRKRGIKEEITYVGQNGSIKKQFKYKGMYVLWDSQTLKGKFYYWRSTFYTSLDAACDGIDRHINHFNN